MAKEAANKLNVGAEKKNGVKRKPSKTIILPAKNLFKTSCFPLSV